MALVRGCSFPDDYLYDVLHHAWYVPLADGLVRCGMTCIGVALAREVIVFTPKRAGNSFEKSRAFATIESAKWVGSVRSGFDGTVVQTNQKAINDPSLINRDCYGEGWLLLARPNAENWRDGLVTGQAMAFAYEAWMEAEAHPGC